MKRNEALLMVILFAFNLLLPGDPDIKIVKNSLSEIESKLGIISLQLVRTWSDDEDGYIFKTPTDIAVDSKNNIYIVDSALHCINVFNSNGQFFRKIGKRGQGPSDLLTPLNIGIDVNNIIWVCEIGNRRIQAFSETGTSLNTIKIPLMITSNIIFPSANKIALYDSNSAKNGDGIIKIIDQSGVIVKKIGINMMPPEVNLPWRGGKYDSHEITYNNKTRIYYVTYKYSQMIQLFQETGAITSCIFYDTPINSLKLAWIQKKGNYEIIENKKYYSECVDLAIDNNGLLFIVTSTRLPQKNERTSMVFYPGGTITYRPISKNYPEKTDMYRLMVFGADGKILAARQLDVFCHGIYIQNNRIFIIDKTFAQAIYEYKYNIKK
jgi:hypothetical protein